MAYPAKYVVLPSGYKLLNTPANLLANALAVNHTAINKEANLSGANLLNKESPIGDKQSSPKVCIIYIPINQIILTFTPVPTPFTPVAIHKSVSYTHLTLPTTPYV